jgi:UDPglucose 6-dehydrogenase
MKKLKICVYGLGHLGQVTTACLAELNCKITAVGRYEIIEEPNLDKLKIKNIKNIEYKTSISTVDCDFDYFWITIDTPVKNEDKANVQYVLNEIDKIITYISYDTYIIISSQLPVGTIVKLEKKYPKNVFACVPENLRHGTAIQNFLNPDRIIIGSKIEQRQKYFPLFKKITNKLIWVDIEEAEMTKHAINSFLATCITWANELGDICKKKNIDYNEVLMGLQSESRIGSKLPLKTGRPYKGGTLARDIKYLIDMSGSKFFKAIRKSNEKRLK